MGFCFFSMGFNFLVAFLAPRGLMKTDGQRTNNNRPRDFRFSNRVFRPPHRLDRPPGRARESDHQGARFGYDQIGMFPPATVVAVPTGGASQSKWARRPGPGTPTCRRPSSLASGSSRSISSSYLEGILEDILEGIEFMSTAPYETVGNNDVLRPHSRRR
jgi:hypothetical protein